MRKLEEVVMLIVGASMAVVFTCLAVAAVSVTVRVVLSGL